MKYQFPTMLRKMWSGQEVQEWLDKIANTHQKENQEAVTEITICNCNQGRLPCTCKLSAQANAMPEQEAVGFAAFKDGKYGSYLHSSEEMARVHDLTAMAGKPRGSEIVPLYTHADPSEVERLRAELESRLTVEEHERLVAKGQELNRAHISKLEQKLAEAQALLRRVRGQGLYNKVGLDEDIDAFLSATDQPAECRGAAINYGLPQGEFQVFGNKVTYPEDPTPEVKTNE